MLDGKTWIIEGVGVPPDIEVDNDPAREYAGNDEQLNRAIQEILAELKTREKDCRRRRRIRRSRGDCWLTHSVRRTCGEGAEVPGMKCFKPRTDIFSTTNPKVNT